MTDYTLGTAAKRLGLSKPTVAARIKAGSLKGEKLPDGSYRIAAGELARFEAEYKRPVKGKRQGEGPTTKRDPASVAAQDIVDLQRQNDALTGQLAAETTAHDRDRDYLERQVADLKERVRDLGRERDQFRRDFERAQDRADTLQHDLNDIAKAAIERGQAPWWQKMIGKG